MQCSKPIIAKVAIKTKMDTIFNKTFSNLLNDSTAKNTNKPLEKIQNDTERDYFLTSDDALEYGLIDKIIEAK